jgi:hypothetical protein
MEKVNKLAINEKEAANKQIAEKLEAAHKLIKECEEIADQHQCYFRFELTYGAGATYTGKPAKEEKAPDFEDSSDEEDSYGWSASSRSC